MVGTVGVKSRKSDGNHVCSKTCAKVMEVTIVKMFATPFYFYFWGLVKDEFNFAFVLLLFSLLPNFISR